jgi:hypothetical protein
MPLLATALAALMLSACGSSPDTAHPAASDTAATISSQRPPAPPAPDPSRAFTVPPPAPGPPADDAVQGLITRSAVWHVPASLDQGETENIALSIGDAQRLQDLIDAAVPIDVPRSPLPVDVTVGTVVRAKLTVISSDATVTPLDTIDKSIGDRVSILFSWQVQPHVSGDLELQAFIACPRADGTVTTETVPLRIRVRPMAIHGPGVGGWAHGVLDAVKDYWIQLTALAGGLAAAIRFATQWYRRRRRGRAGQPSHLGSPEVAPGHPQVGGDAETDGEPDDSDDLGVGVGVPQRDHQDRRAEQR